MSTYDSLRTSGNSTCDGGIVNRSAYWIPLLINNNVPVAPDLMFVYYKSGYRSVAPRAINNIPNGLRMIAGNAKANSAQSGEVVMWSCESEGSTIWAWRRSRPQSWWPASCSRSAGMVAILIPPTTSHIWHIPPTVLDVPHRIPLRCR